MYFQNKYSFTRLQAIFKKLLGLKIGKKISIFSLTREAVKQLVTAKFKCFGNASEGTVLKKMHGFRVGVGVGVVGGGVLGAIHPTF